MDKPINKILVFRLSSIGDIILTSPLLRCLRKTYPNAQIDFVIKKQFRFLIEDNAYINNIYTVDKSLGVNGLKQLGATLNQQQYDVFLDIHKNYRSLLISKLAKPKKVFRYKKKCTETNSTCKI